MVHKSHHRHGDRLIKKSIIIYSCPCGFGFRFYSTLVKHLADGHGKIRQENNKLICNLTPDFEEYEITNLTGDKFEQISPISIKYGSQRQRSMIECEQESESCEDIQKNHQQYVPPDCPFVVEKNQRKNQSQTLKRGRPCKKVTSNQLSIKIKSNDKKLSFVVKGKPSNINGVKFGVKVFVFYPTGTKISNLMSLYLDSQASNQIDRDQYLQIRQTVAVFTLLIYCEVSYSSLYSLDYVKEKDLLSFLNYFSISYLPSSLKFQQIRKALQIMNVIDLFISKQYLFHIWKWIDWCNLNKVAEFKIKANMNSPFIALTTRI